ARELTKKVYKLTRKPAFSKNFGLKNQIHDAAGSSMHNIAEGFDAGTNPEFIRFLKISRRSASEVQSELYLALDRNYINQDELTVAYNIATEVKRLVNGMIGYLRKS
ncbi:MAG: four helix bundle protein, partial [Anaerolineales bacterium]|nr:four helix bundle protein [Anaerolineales bacterium]